MFDFQSKKGSLCLWKLHCDPTLECEIKFLYCWLDMKTNYPLFKSNCIFASDFRSFAGAPISLDVLLHVLEVVLQLLDPVRSSCGSDRQLVPVVPDVNQGHNQGQSEESSGNTKKQPVDSISQVSCVRSFLFLFFSIPQTSLPCRKRNLKCDW